MKKHYTFSVALFLLMSLILGGCWLDYDDNYTYTGYRPVYGSQDRQEIRMTSARTIESPGKIYVYGNFLLVNEAQEGIHVFDNSNPESPRAIGFIQMLGNTDMAIRNDVLYADHMGNLVALEINDFETLTQKGSLSLANWNLGIPPPAGYYFECVDPAKGLVVRWEEIKTKRTDCYANF
ncbi:MAG TPA: hypothetical protein VIN08_21810 [Ohtaekwangia sp.]|uniref:hypothetical protein n=1 Tax=Ohtaekwangia sp. TaxID=2066019 RepID=UPI002F930EA6